MTFDEVLSQVQDLLQREKRVSYRGLKRRFALDDECLEDLKEELIGAKRLAADEDGRFLVWRGTPETVSAPSSMLASSPPAPPATEPHTLDAERRQLTVEFIDLVGSTALSQQLDPEDLRAVVQAYRETCASVIRRFEGYLAKYIGDGLLVYFGYPVAHEDDAQRAVRTALGIVEAMQKLSFPALQLPRPLQVHIGIHTGLVVAGEMGTADQPEHLAIVGETPNIAARLQEKAAPNSVVISPTTYRLVTGLFDCQELGRHELKGLSQPLALYQVVQESAAQSRFEAAVQTGLTPLVGRTEELALLQQRWEQAKRGAGQVVLLSGEPGIGKSRLMQEFKERLAHEGVTRIEFHCSPYHQNSALYPIIDHLQRLLQFAREDTSTVKLEKLQHTLSHYRFPEADTVPLLAALLSLPHPEGSPPLSGSPQKQKEKTQAALVAWLVEEAEKAAVYCTWEDLHWADPSTLEVLDLIIDQVPTVRLYVLLTFRPEFTSPWGNRSHLSQLTLSRLGPQQVEAMVERVTGGKALPVDVLQQIVSKTDGVPLFVEELTKSVLESVGAHSRAPLQALAIPATLQDSLMARLDRLGTAKEIAQLGATIGRDFSYELLHLVSPVNEESLQQGLKQLVEAELVYQRGLLPQAQYLFKHALVQDTAYQSLLKSKRQPYHQQIAHVLEAQFPDTKERQPELLAHHYTEAGLIEQAIPYWQQAGQKAVACSANVEAVAHLTRGLEVLKTLPDTPERVQQELTLQLVLSNALFAVKGYAAPGVEKAMTRARELCQQLGETPQLFPVLWRLVVFYFNRGEVRTAHELAEQMMRLAQSVQDQYLLSWAHKALGWTWYFLGELTSTRMHAEQAIALYDPQKHPPSIVGMEDPRLDCLSYAAWTLWQLGYPDQALTKSQEAVALAKGLSRPFSLALALGFAAWFHSFRRAEQLAREQAEAVITLSTEQGFPYWLANGTMVRGGALTEQGQVEEGIAHIQQGLAAFRAMGAEVGVTWSLAMLAEAHGKVGQVGEGLAVLAEALDLVDKTGERVKEAELYRLKGELTLQNEARGLGLGTGSPSPQAPSLKPQVPRGVEQEAEECFLKAIEVARKQQAKSLELRAAMSLARLWQQQSKKAEARRLLAEVYNWFTEGFDTKDLQEAKRLIEELS
ncbi:MAG TPA: adenylate/guanylate cyclase domain-containing protein [Candidatus Binatia bacterium]|jgi:predicted ATPase/class 3 adenylate cyclase|nr:adenylate/guanylate cyclase domain-containing protein [Candidatus Binatia bacterium]